MLIYYSLSFQRAAITTMIVFIVSLFYFIAWRSVHYIRTVRPFWSRLELHATQKFWFGFISEFATVWHGFELHGDENVKDENCLLVGYHARFAVDIAYIIARLQCKFLVNHTTFNIPITGQVLTSLGAISSNSDKSSNVAAELFERTLSQGVQPLIVLPGGSYECLKPVNEVGKLSWKDEPGFARALVDHPATLGQHTSVVPFYTKNCEQTAFISRWFYDLTGKTCRRAAGCSSNSLLFLAMVVIFLLSLGFPFLPRPVKLDAHFGTPLTLRDGESAKSFATRVRHQLQRLIDEVEARPERPYPRGRPGLVMRVFLGSIMVALTSLIFGLGFLLYIVVVHPLAMAKRMVCGLL